MKQGSRFRDKGTAAQEKTPVNKEPVSFHLTWILYDSVALGVVLACTFACAFIRLQLHKMRTSTGESLVEVDETQVRARASTITGGTWVRSWKRKGQSRNVRLYILKMFMLDALLLAVFLIPASDHSLFDHKTTYFELIFHSKGIVLIYLGSKSILSSHLCFLHSGNFHQDPGTSGAAVLNIADCSNTNKYTALSATCSCRIYFFSICDS